MIGPEVRERVRWSDVDIMGVVYYARYVRFVELAEGDFFHAIALPSQVIADRFGVWLARVRLEMDFRSPAKLDDVVIARAELERIGGSSLTFRFPIRRAQDERLLVEAKLVLAALDRVTLRPVRLPAELRAALGG